MSIVEMKVPSIGESINEVTLSQWLKANGEYVERDEPICEFESDKATLEFPAEVAGKLLWVAAEGDDLAIGALVAKIDTSVVKVDRPAKEVEEPATNRVVPAPAASGEDGLPAKAANPTYALGHPSPAAAKLIAENNLSARDIMGTGKDGRITKSDVLHAIERKHPSEPTSEQSMDSIPPSTSLTQMPSVVGRSTRREKMSRMRRTIAARLVSAKNNTAMLTTFNEVDLTEVIKLRKRYQEKFVEKFGIKLGFMSLFARACAQVLMEMPHVNAQLDGNELIYHDYVDISIAISTPSGLVVPPVHNAESLRFHEIELKIKELAEKARNGTLSLEEMRGGTFTITNGGIFGSMMSTPILNEPQSAILGMHTIQQRPIAVEGEVVVRPMMYVALSYDHRVIDGSSSVTFLVRVKQLLEDPVSLLLDL
ncbi:MAG: 2-oxoglutarate dehydrogenase complex dihydrolipoyllysine-residue succinyltransferase [Saprospiraceae bacterium]|nr:2-oxoglutarate dehydrogenase complex dihydrolipoyllysine-residue succinyltransferase [Saprospiraceae bacterium]